jgi:hypothetical protein
MGRSHPGACSVGRADEGSGVEERLGPKTSCARACPDGHRPEARQCLVMPPHQPIACESYCFDEGRLSLHRSRSTRRQPTARPASLTGEGKLCSAVIEHGTRRLAHVNVTNTAECGLDAAAATRSHRGRRGSQVPDPWPGKHLREVLDDSIGALGLAVLRAPFSSPKANAICERVIGTIRRECLDWMIPMSEGHLRSILREWVAHYNGERPHSALGPGVPGPPAGSACAPKPESRRRWTPGALVRAKSVLGGLHNEYSLSSTPALP